MGVYFCLGGKVIARESLATARAINNRNKV